MSVKSKPNSQPTDNMCRLIYGIEKNTRTKWIRALFLTLELRDKSIHDVGFSPLHLQNGSSAFCCHLTKLYCVCVQPYLTLCDPMDYSPPSSSVHEIFLTRILEWAAISFSKLVLSRWKCKVLSKHVYLDNQAHNLSMLSQLIYFWTLSANLE